MKYKNGEYIEVLSPHQEWVTGTYITRGQDLLSVELKDGHILYVGEEYTRPHSQSSLVLDTSELLVGLLEENHRLLEENEALKAKLKEK